MSRRAAAAASAGLLGLMVLTAVPAVGSSAFAGVRQATASLHTVAAAEAAGYQEFLPCFDSPGVGGMGQHYADLGSIDGLVDSTHPEVLVFEPRGDHLRLVAVEYVVPQAAWSSTGPPELFGEQFHRNDTLGIWALHAWIWRPNADGMHADYNPKVALCP